MAQAPAVPKKQGWKAPPRRYFGPRDPDTGERLEEPEYIHQDFPKCVYHESAEPVVVDDEDALAALGPGWAETPFGPMTHPSAEDILKAKLATVKAKK